MAVSSTSNPTHTRKRKRLSPNDYTIACICPMGVELAPLQALLDTIHDDLPTQRDHNAYTLGEMGKHNVVIAVLPCIGNNGSGIAASQIRKDFPAIQFALLVGIGGGVPGSLQTDDIRLGDVVVSKQYGDGNFERIGYLNKPPAFLIATVERLKALHQQKGSRIKEFVSEILRRYPSMQSSYRHPGSENDQLFESDYFHVGGDTCQACDTTRTRQRAARLGDEAYIHYGTIGSSNSVIKDAVQRDKLHETHRVICVEMEAAGMMDAFPCLVIRGICDYSDSHKNYQWQRYAAATAAAYAKELLLLIPQKSNLALPADPSNRRNEPARVAHAEFMSHFETNPSEQSFNHKHCKVEDQDRYQRLFESLAFERMDARLWNIADALRHTCKWVFKDARYRKWLSRNEVEDHHGFLWIKGKPGSGKSTMMKEIFKNFKKGRSGDVNISYFFNARAAGQLEKSTIGMYRILVYQILESCPHFRNQFKLTFASKRLESSIIWTKTELQGFLNEIVEKLDRPLNILIDALDEGDENDVRQLIEFLRSMTLRAFEDQKSLRICLSSRHYPHISIDNGLSLVLEHHDGHKEDIELYVRSNFVIEGGSRIESLRDQICQKSSQVFLWVVLVIAMLKRLYDHGQITEMERRLKKLPRDLDNLFVEILNRDSEDLGPTIALLQWVSFAMRPLSPVELYHATQLGQLKPSIDNEVDFSEDCVSRYLLHCSRGLTEVTKTKPPAVQFIHETVREFLTSGSGLKRILSPGVTKTEGTSHERLKTTCLRYLVRYLPLNTNSQGKGAPKCEHTVNDVHRIYPFAKYAISHMFSYAEAAQDNNVAQRPFLQMFNKPLSIDLMKWVQYRNTFQRYEVRKYSKAVYLLYALAEQNFLKLAEILISMKVNVNDVGERWGNALQAASVGGHEQMVRLLLKNGAIVNAAGGEHDYAFCAAIHRKHESIATLFLRNGPLPPLGVLEKLLFVVAARGYLKGVEILLDAGTPITCRNNRGENLFLFAAKKGNVAVLDVLLQRKIQAATSDEDVSRALLYAMEAKRMELVQLLFEKLDTGNVNGVLSSTLLLVAVRRDFKDIAIHLIEKGVKQDAVDGNGNTALFDAVNNNRLDLVQVLLCHGANVNAFGCQGPVLEVAVAKGYLEIAELLIEKGANVNAVFSAGQSPIYTAAFYRQKDLVLALLHKGADVNAQSGKRYYPLTGAIKSCSEDVVRLLLNRGANANVVDGRYGSPLCQALNQGSADIAKLLIMKGANVNSRGPNMRSAIYVAASKGLLGVVHLLLQNGVNANAQNGHDGQPLIAAIWARSEEVVRLLLDYGTDLNKTSGDSLSQAINVEQLNIFKLLIEKGADINAPDLDGVRPIYHAAHQCQKDMVQILLQNGADVNVLGGFYGFPLTAATSASRGLSGDVLRLLLDYGANVNAIGGCIGSALNAAIDHEREEIVKLLIEKGADVNLRAKASVHENDSPLEIAIRKNNKSIARILIENGADTSHLSENDSRFLEWLNISEA
ncbi:MAG: hypothetical protein Q9160_004202 [Pyrenula sp. 1 TL-2023]